MPHRGEQIVLADDALAVSDQVKQQVENLWFDGNRCGTTKQLTAIRIERVLLKQISHVPHPSRCMLDANRNGTGPSQKIKVIVTAR